MTTEVSGTHRHMYGITPIGGVSPDTGNATTEQISVVQRARFDNPAVEDDIDNVIQIESFCCSVRIEVILHDIPIMNLDTLPNLPDN